VNDVSPAEGTPSVTHPQGKAKPAKTIGNSNPLMDYQYGADPYAMTCGGRVYIYMTSDGSQYDESGNVVQTYECDGSGNITANSYGQIRTLTIISSADLVNWTNEGQVKVAETLLSATGAISTRTASRSSTASARGFRRPTRSSWTGQRCCSIAIVGAESRSRRTPG
jgi:type II secretory pathway pseudopilin PulG